MRDLETPAPAPGDDGGDSGDLGAHGGGDGNKGTCSGDGEVLASAIGAGRMGHDRDTGGGNDGMLSVEVEGDGGSSAQYVVNSRRRPSEGATLLPPSGDEAGPF